MEKYWKQFQNCLQKEAPFCTNTCPFHMEVLEFQEKMARKSYNAAYKTFRNTVAFPDIVAALCPSYCSAVCPRKDSDQAVQLNLLEKTCVARATKKEPTDYNVPKKDAKIAVVGAGLSGLACALRLAQKKYDVTIYEKTDRLGGQLWDLLPSELFLADISRQFQHEIYALHLNTEIKSREELNAGGFQAVYVATGSGGPDFGISGGEDGHCLIEDKTAFFAGGSLMGKDVMQALAEGLSMAWAIEVFVKAEKLEYPEEMAACRIVADPDKLKKTDPVLPTDNGLFTDEEVVEEANRCIRCQCDGCMTYCDLFAYHKKWPLRVRDDIMSTIAPSESMLHKTPATRLLNTCTQCGLCDEVCTGGIEITAMMLDARRRLHKLDKMPGGYHQFWVRDMEFTNSDLAAISKKAPGHENCTYAFFPGCQLGAGEPRYVSEVYKWLLQKKPDTGLLLRCCSVPAEWAGNEAMHDMEICALKEEWESLGKPILIMACPACKKHLQQYLPEIKTTSLYEILDQESEAWPSSNKAITYSVFDPCTARNDEAMEAAVRSLVKKAGCQFEELPNGDKHGCCGYGGHVSVANADYASYVAKRRSSLSENPYIAYCSNCRDVFEGEGKPVSHILELLFPIDREDSLLPHLTQRRYNRIKLKETLLYEIWGEKMEEEQKSFTLDLLISPEIREKMDRLKLIEEDIATVIEQSEADERQTYDPKTELYTCYREIGHVTCWVQYRIMGAQREIINVYTHRMKIKLEGVWNGRKTDAALQ